MVIFLPYWSEFIFLDFSSIRKLEWKSLRSSVSINALLARVYIYIRQLSSALLGRPRSDCRYLPYPKLFSEFTPMFFTRKRTKRENTRSPPFSYDMKMAAYGRE